MLDAPPATDRVAPSISLDTKLEHLRALFRALGSVLVCYSGGIDSALLLAVAHEVLGERAVAMTAVSPSLAPAEKEAAQAVARQLGARHELVDSHELDDERYAQNGADRCFYCKSELYAIAAKMQREWGLAAVVNGVNQDDLGDYRPGLEAAKNTGARSPLVECGFHKSDVREAARALGLAIWDKPASACLSSRLPYGTRVTTERLAQVAALEASLRGLGLTQLRVRWHAASERPTASGSASVTNAVATEAAIARIEVAKDELVRAFEARERIVELGKAHGFSYVTLDLQGYRQGSHNEVLDGRRLRVV